MLRNVEEFLLCRPYVGISTLVVGRFKHVVVSTNQHMDNTCSLGVEVDGTANQFHATLELVQNKMSPTLSFSGM